LTEDGFVTPIAAALALLRRAPSLLVWLILIAVATGSRALLAQAYSGRIDASQLLALQAISTFAPVLIDGALLFFLARTLVARQAGGASPLFARFLGVFIAAFFIDWMILAIGRFAIFFGGGSSRFMMTYGSVLVGSLGMIATFPFLVRTLTAAAGSEAPKLPGIVALSFGEERYAYVWYATCAIFFPVLMVYAFANVLPSGNQANDLPGNLLQSVITGTGGLLRYLLAAVVGMHAVSRGEKSLAETFA